MLLATRFILLLLLVGMVKSRLHCTIRGDNSVSAPAMPWTTDPSPSIADCEVKCRDVFPNCTIAVFNKRLVSCFYLHILHKSSVSASRGNKIHTFYSTAQHWDLQFYPTGILDDTYANTYITMTNQKVGVLVGKNKYKIFQIKSVSSKEFFKPPSWWHVKRVMRLLIYKWGHVCRGNRLREDVGTWAFQVTGTLSCRPEKS